MSWVEGVAGTPYGLRNLPYGVFRHGGREPRIGVRVGDLVLDLDGAEAAGLILAGGALRRPVLNDLMALGRPQWRAVRARITELLTAPGHEAAVRPLLVPLAEVELVLPVAVGVTELAITVPNVTCVIWRRLRLTLRNRHQIASRAILVNQGTIASPPASASSHGRSAIEESGRPSSVHRKKAMLASAANGSAISPMRIA